MFGIALLIFLAAIGGLIKPYIPNWERKHFGMMAVGGFIGMLALVPPPPNRSPNGNVTAASNEQTSQPTNAQSPSPTPPAPTPPDAQYAQALEREITALRQAPRLTNLTEDQAGVMTGVVLIGARAQLLRDAPRQKRPETIRMEAEYRRLQEAFQRDLFPRLRRIQVRIWNAALWESNVEAASLGARAETVRFTGGMFAANSNIARAHESALETLRSLRFRRDSYEWYRGSRSWQYDMEAVSDDTIAILGANGQWTPVTAE